MASVGVILEGVRSWHQRNAPLGGGESRHIETSWWGVTNWRGDTSAWTVMGAGGAKRSEAGIGKGVN